MKDEGDRVHREVAAREVVGEITRRDIGQGPRARVGLAPRGDEVQVPPMGELHPGGAEPLVRHHPTAQIPTDPGRQGDRLALHHHVDVRSVRHAQDGVPHRAPDEADARCRGGPPDAREDRIARDPCDHRASIGLVGDHVAHNLSAAAPVALDGLAEAIARWEGRSLDELQRASDRMRADVRSWAEDPANAERPISDSPVYLDRMAVEVLIERRFFTE